MLIIIIGGKLCSILFSVLVSYIASGTKTNYSRSLICNKVSTYYGNICLTSSLCKSSSYSSWWWWYWAKVDCQAKPLAVDLVSIPLCTSWCICSIFLDLYKLPCLWMDRFISIFPYSLCCKYVGVIVITLPPHPFGSTSGGFSFIVSKLIRTLGRLIALLLFEVP